MANRITTIFEGDATKLKNALKDVGKAMGEAHGFTNTLKAGVSGTIAAFKDFAKTPAGITAMSTAVAGAGVAAFEAADKWSKLGIEVDRFATAAGVSDEAASRWIEVAGDLGVETESVEKSIGFMNKTLGNSPALFEQLGITIAKSSSGATDANGTFLNVIQRLKDIKDPAERAATGTKLLGRSWQNMSELISQGSTELSKRLREVDQAKVFDDEKVAKAKAFRDTIDNLGDSFQELVLSLGENVLPLVESLAEGIATVVGAANDLINAGKSVGEALNFHGKLDVIKDAEGALRKMAEATTETDRETRKLEGTMVELADAATNSQNSTLGYSYAAKDAKDTTERLAKEQEHAKDAAKAHADQLQREIDKLEVLYPKAYDAVQAHFAYKEAVAASDEAIKGLNDRTKDQQDELDAAKEKILDTAVQYATMDGAAEGSEGAIRRQIESLKAQEAELGPDSPLRKFLDEYIAALARIPSDVATNLHLAVNGVNPTAANQGGVLHGTFAQGGVVPGARGQPMPILAHGGEEISQPGQGSGGGDVIYLTVNAGIATDGYRVGQQIVNALTEYKRRTARGL